MLSPPQLRLNAQIADIGSKRLISLAPDAWVQWVTQRPDIQTSAILAAEFQWVSRESDVLVKAVSPQFGEFLVLNELQLRYTLDMPRRMRAYAALAEEKYNLQVYPVLVNILPLASTVEIVNCYQSEFMGLRARQDYRLINLWEIEADLVLQQRLPALLPFVPILKGGGEEAVVRQAVQLLRADEQLKDLEPLLSFFASFVLGIPLIRQIMRWDMAVLRESPWYQEILQEGLSKGLQQGLQQGLKEGRQEEAVSLVLRLVNRQIGSISPRFQEQIKGLAVTQLEALGEALLDFSSESDLEDWLGHH